MIKVNLKTIKRGDAVFYIPRHIRKLIEKGYTYTLQGKDMESEREHGVVSSKNDSYIFVKYDGKFTAQATNPEDLFIDKCQK